MDKQGERNRTPSLLTFKETFETRPCEKFLEKGVTFSIKFFVDVRREQLIRVMHLTIANFITVFLEARFILHVLYYTIERYLVM